MESITFMDIMEATELVMECFIFFLQSLNPQVEPHQINELTREKKSSKKNYKQLNANLKSIRLQPSATLNVVLLYNDFHSFNVCQIFPFSDFRQIFFSRLHTLENKNAK